MNKVLVVDDDQDILDVVSMLLSLNNYEVTTLSRATHIHDTILSFSPDVILLDVALGGDDGREVCRRLKHRDDTMGIPVILFSAHYDLVNNIASCQADDFVTKPFDVQHLLSVIRQQLDRSAYN